MTQENRTEPEVLDEEKSAEVSDESLEGVSGGLLHRHIRRKPQPEIDKKPSSDSEDGSGGATGSW